MKQAVLVVVVAALFSCGQSEIKAPAAAKDGVDIAQNAGAPGSKTLVLGERINGPANIRDTVNGEVIFSLFDKRWLRVLSK